MAWLLFGVQTTSIIGLLYVKAMKSYGGQLLLLHPFNSLFSRTIW